jgi:hypothetical protein
VSKHRASALPLPVVDFLDTSVFVEILDVPFMNDHRVEVMAEMDRRLAADVRFVLPTATVIESGNHVFQIKDGRARRSCAHTFMRFLAATAEGRAPWVLHERTWDAAFLTSLCEGGCTGATLAEHSERCLLGAGDLSILVERDMYAARVRASVRIWTLEKTMQTWADG